MEDIRGKLVELVDTENVSGLQLNPTDFLL